LSARGILDFDSKQLDLLLKKFGLKKAWVSILATHISGTKHLEYVLDSKDFKGTQILDVDLIQGLSIGEIGVLYEYSHASIDANSRKSNGQFFTPDDVAQFMVGFASKFPEGRWLDPCSGIGNLSWHLVSLQSDPEEFLLRSMYLSDKDEVSLLIARTLLTVSFQDRYKNLFNTIEKNFVCFDFLSVADNGQTAPFAKANDLESIPAHDFIIVNPPYLALSRDDRFETARSSDLYAYFLENIIKTSQGFISITPQSFTNAAKFRDLRALLLRNYSNLTIFNFDNVPGNIFRGIKFGSRNTNTANSIRAAVIVAHPGKGIHQITSLLRWRSHERKRLFTDAHKFLSNVALTDDFFPKVGKKYQSLYSHVSDLPKLGTICSPTPTTYSLHIPSSPRYFIPALKNPVKRSSQHEIFFRSEAERERAYLVINSSLMYWWWRVRDGGMTLSQETLFSLPMPPVRSNNKMVKLLEESESTNKVYKQNAGSPQENVKHPRSLMVRLNNEVLPEFADLIIGTHENSDFFDGSN
jgi:hypothetical protein